MSDDPTRVLYIAGVPHSGTTIVSQILGELPGVSAVGELYYLWSAWTRGLPCGCGLPVAECDHWKRVLASALGDEAGIDQLRPDRYYMALRRLPEVAVGWGGAPSGAYRRAVARVMGAVREEAGARVVVDASKSPTYGRILEGAPGLDVRILHLVRSPFGTAHSWSRLPGVSYAPARHAALWNAWNGAIEALWGVRRDRYLRLRYEDFAADPQAAIAKIARFAGLDATGMPFVDTRTVRLHVTHTVAGNAVRFTTGDVTIRSDEAWRRGLPERDHRLIGALTWPLRKYYAYPLGDR